MLIISNISVNTVFSVLFLFLVFLFHGANWASSPHMETCSLALSFTLDQDRPVLSPFTRCFILLLSYYFIYIISLLRSKFVIVSSLCCIFFKFFSRLISFFILFMFISSSSNFYLLCLFSFLLIQPAQMINFPLNIEFTLIPQTLNTYLSCNYWPNNIYIRLQETHTSGKNHGNRVGQDAVPLLCPHI